MGKFTMEDLVRVMRAAAGEDGQVDLDEKVRQCGFDELGYDSLAVLETASRVEREYGVILDEEAMALVETPTQFVALVNGQLASLA
ncbi:act minimal PKS acyl carrier protein [Saccharothrix ecbatanensis]|jgi:act minimal PKS acyl carrier protein|uniref:Act minimal PKS acyl carrier protein n=1 Tax=Saccharothrix ecbatanensis TaxID=1105145 RepID=A0A7W9HH52_9PSEU|nr:phosphopantetheine-binding protein [Saccharothrix ecbatanensis]MBB5802202.1 act minimal PKS acyl carrier protein [Saccharothrix ecbatanensis]